MRQSAPVSRGSKYKRASSSRQKPHGNPLPPRTKAWAYAQGELKPKTNRTYQAQDAEAYWDQRHASDDQFLFDPPANTYIIECRLVLPGKHKLPRGLDKPGALDEVRRNHKAWIDQPEPNILDIRAETIFALQNAVKAVNRTIHDMRLSSEHPYTRYLVQPPTTVAKNAAVSIRLNARPEVIGERIPRNEDASRQVAANLLDQIGENELRASSATLQGLGKDIQMRINLGQLQIQMKKRGIGDKLAYDELPEFLKPYAFRDGAKMSPDMMTDFEKAETTIKHLADPDQGFRYQNHDVVRHCDLTLVTQGYEFRADIVGLETNEPRISTVKVTKPERWPRLNWTVLAPDKRFDWNIYVNAWDKPLGVQPVLEKMVVLPQEVTNENYLQFPRFSMPNLSSLEGNLSELRCKSSAIIPFRDSPYSLQVGVTQTWKDISLSDQPTVTWGMELYGNHWAGIMNTVGSDLRRKDWGEDDEEIWPGQGNLGNRFTDFLSQILEVQDALEGVLPAT